jgi:hypothetical protein
MSSSAVLGLRVLAFCSEDGGVKVVGEVKGADGGVEGELVTLAMLTVGLVLAGGVVLPNNLRGRCILIAASLLYRFAFRMASLPDSRTTTGCSLGAFVRCKGYPATRANDIWAPTGQSPSRHEPARDPSRAADPPEPT